MTEKMPQALFQNVSTIDDVAAIIGISSKQLRFLIYARPEGERYTIFTIAKRRGGIRTIKAPKKELKIIQQRFISFIQDRIGVRPAAHGFVRKKNIVTNAQLHINHRAVFNLDLREFFPTINFGRVRGLFISEPFKASPTIATILAQICCHAGSLPQGAPTSPFISNMICFRLDAQLTQLARNLGCVYTRYADDLTFSKRKGLFPSDLALVNEDGSVSIGKELVDIIENNGFKIHTDKVHLYRNTHRQTVTGLTVNDRVNVERKFVRDIRAMICDWRRRGLQSAQETHHQNFYRHQYRLSERPPLQRIIEGKLNFLRMVRGVDDPVRKNLQRQFAQVYPEYQMTLEKENKELNIRDLFISHVTEDKNDFVRPLVQALISEGVSVWYDEFELNIGDDLIVKINTGLRTSRYGVVILSPNFFNVKKTWPDREVGAMFAMEDADKRTRVLPIWHNIDQQAVAEKNPILASKFAWKSSDYLTTELAKKFKDFVKLKRG